MCWLALMYLGELSQGRIPLFKSVFNHKGNLLFQCIFGQLLPDKLYYMAMAASHGTEPSVIMLSQYEM